MQDLAPCLWFDGKAEEAAHFYVGAIPNSSVDHVERVRTAFAGLNVGDVLAAEFTLAGRRFKALNGGPMFKFTEAVSFVLECDDQAEIDTFWTALSAVPEAEQCGWCKDRFGLSWQIVPKRLYELLSHPDEARSARVAQAMMAMKKLDLEALEAA